MHTCNLSALRTVAEGSQVQGYLSTTTVCREAVVVGGYSQLQVYEGEWVGSGLGQQLAVCGSKASPCPEAVYHMVIGGGGGHSIEATANNTGTEALRGVGHFTDDS